MQTVAATHLEDDDDDDDDVDQRIEHMHIFLKEDSSIWYYF